MLLPNTSKIAVTDLANGLVIYDGGDRGKIKQLGRVAIKLDPYCAQAVCSFCTGEFIGVAATCGKVEIYETNGMVRVLSLRMSSLWS